MKKMKKFISQKMSPENLWSKKQIWPLKWSFLVLGESESNEPRIGIEEDPVASTQHAYGNWDAKDSVEAINDND